MRWLWAVLPVAMVGCAEAPTAEESGDNAAAVSGTTANEPLPRSELPEAHAFLGWTDDTMLVDAPRPTTGVAVSCADTKLYPTHPSADRKKYHRLAIGRFDHFKVDGDSSVCKIKGTSKDPRTGLRRCAAADTIEYAILSDTFEDACGNFYRGYWEVSFLKMDETMGSLFSLGRTVYEKPNSEFAGDYYDAQTYPVDSQQLLVIAPLLEGDATAITRGRERATSSQTHRYDAATHVWSYVGPYR